MLIIDQLSRGRWMWLVTGGAVAAASAFSGCSGGFDSCTADKNCGPFDGGAAGTAGVAGGAGHGGSGGSAGQAGAGAQGGSVSGTGGMAGEAGAAGSGVVPCDTTKTPTEEACLVSDDYAVFVAPNGQDTAAGTMDAPFATLSNAITMAGGVKFVVVCDATYDEHVVLGGGAVVYGGFSCAGGQWATEAGAPLFKPSDAGPALNIDGVSKSVVIETVNFEVQDAKVPGGTALAALVNASPSVTLRNVSLTAGAGMNGADGTLELFSYVAQALLNGNAESAAGVGGAEKDCTCQTGLMSVGGLGGSPASSGQNGADGLPALGGGQAGDHTKACSNGGGGGDGDDALAVAAGAASGALSLGTASATGWQGASGVDGPNGSPGQGGGGGASRNNLGHGGGGGCGGCGGNGAKAGQGGGASIALLAVSSPVTLDRCTLTTKDAGNGGAGHVGQQGQQLGGNGGNAIASANSCGGGTGGKGGDGAASGGGAGGISVGVLWKGAMAPTLTNSATTTGKAGTKGIGGVPAANDGIDGVKQDVLNVP